jgi:hypothetical protein
MMNGAAHDGDDPDTYPGVDPLAAALLRQHDRATRQASDERREQTEAWTGALERQTDRLASGQSAQTRVILALALVGMLLAAGRDFVLTGLGVSLSAGTAALPVAAAEADTDAPTDAATPAEPTP